MKNDMSEERFYIMNENGKFERYDDRYDVTIHFESQKEQDDFIALLKNLNDLKMELPGQQDTH